MLLRRLSERYPALCGDLPDRRTGFAAFAAKLGAELEMLRCHPCRIEPDAVFPQGLLLAFAPERRQAVLNGRPERADWDHVAAVRLAQLLAGVRFPLRRAEFDRTVRQWLRQNVSRAEGPSRFVRDVLNGRDGDRRLLLQPVTMHGAELVRFLARGSTSEVWLIFWRERTAVLKLPVPGAETRFRAELELLAALRRPEVLVTAGGREPYCVMEFCRPAAPGELRERWSELRESLTALHRRGVLHGDIRRSNLGIRADGAPVLYDYSHARKPDAAEMRRAAGREMEKLRSLVLKGA